MDSAAVDAATWWCIMMHHGYSRKVSEDFLFEHFPDEKDYLDIEMAAGVFEERLRICQLIEDLLVEMVDVEEPAYRITALLDDVINAKRSEGWRDEPCSFPRLASTC